LRKILQIILFIQLITYSVVAQNKGIFNKNKNFLSQTEVLKNITDSSQIISSMQSVLNNIYNNGYLSAKIDSVNIDSNFTKVYYYKGELIRWGDVIIISEENDLLNRQGINSKDFINKPAIFIKLVQFINKIITYYENRGYPFVKVDLQPIKFKNNKIYVELIINKYELYTIDSIIIKGNSTVNRKILSKIIDIYPGNLYNEQKLSKISERINNTEFISEVKPFELEFTEKKTSVYTYLKNEKANTIDGIIGFQPNNKTTGKLLITGEINLLLLNSFKKAESILFKWKKLESSSQELDFNIVYPYIRYSDLGSDFYLSFYKKDSSYLNLESIFGLRYQLGGSNYLKLFYQRNSSNVLKQNISFINYKSTLSNLFGIGFYIENLDYKYNPRKGYNLNCKFGFGKKLIKNEEPGENIKSEVNLYGAAFIPLLRKFVIKLQNNTGIYIDDKLFENELYLIGGFNNLRGFDEKSIQASLYTISTVEFGYLFEKKSNVYLFYDICYYEKKISDTDFSDWPNSFGIGLSFSTNSGIFSMNYALGKQLNNPVNLSSAKIHIGYINRF